MTETTTQEGLPDPITSNVEGTPITGSTDDIIKQSVQLNRKRAEEGTLAFDDGPTERTWHLTTNPTLKEATDKITAEKKVEFGREYLQSFGMNPTDDEAHQIGDEAAARGRKPSEPPAPRKIGVADNEGRIFQPIDDLHRHLWMRDDTGTAKEVTRAVTNNREVAAAAEAEEIARLEQVARELEFARLQGEGQDASPQAQRVEATPAAPTGQQPVAAAPTVAQPQQPQASDPLAKERQALVAEQRRLGEINQLSAAELNLHVQSEQWRSWARQNFPELKDAAQLEYVRRTNPGRWAQLEKANHQINLRNQQIGQIRAARDLKERQIGEIRQQQQKAALVEYKKAEDDKYAAWANKNLPQFRSDKGMAQHREAVKQILRDTGMTDVQIAQQWDNGFLRPFGFQVTLAKAAAYEIQRQQLANRDVALAHKSTAAPQPLQPGVFMPTRGVDEESNIGRLERNLGAAQGERASLRAATRLLQAQRRAGRL